MKRRRKEDPSNLERTVAVIRASIFFGIASIIVIFVIQYSFTLSLSSLFLRALPGIAFGTWLGIRYPKVALRFGFISIG